MSLITYKKSRNRLRPVNPDPRPPNETQSLQNKGQDNQSKITSNTGALALANKMKPIKPTVSANPASVINPALPPPTPQNVNKPSGPNNKPGYAPPTDPRDATYWQNLIRLQHVRDTEVNRLNLEGTYAKSSYEDNVDNLNRLLPRNILAAKENANAAGAFYSSRTGENIGRIEQESFLAKSGLERGFQSEEGIRSLMRNAINSGYTIDEAAELAAAVARAAQAEINRPAPAEEFNPIEEALAEYFEPSVSSSLVSKPGHGTGNIQIGGATASGGGGKPGGGGTNVQIGTASRPGGGPNNKPNQNPRPGMMWKWSDRENRWIQVRRP